MYKYGITHMFKKFKIKIKNKKHNILIPQDVKQQDAMKGLK